MKKSNLYTAAKVLLLAFIDPGPAPGYADVFSDQKGRLFNADLVSYDSPGSERITIRRNGKEFEVKISQFSEGSQEDIRKWMKENAPKKYEYRFDIKERKKRGEKNSYAYDISLKNIASNQIPGIKIEYLVFMKDSLGAPVSRGDSMTVDTPLANGKTVNFSTKVFDPDKLISKGPSGVVSISSTASSSNQRKLRLSKSLLGVLVRVYDINGKLVADWRSSGSSFKGTWPKPKGGEKAIPEKPKFEIK